MSAATARSIIVLATSDEPDQADARTLRVVLSLMGLHDHLKTTGKQAHGLAVSWTPINTVPNHVQADNSFLFQGPCAEAFFAHTTAPTIPNG